MHDFPYSIPERRALTEEERVIIRRLVSAACPERRVEADALEVFARCGCGKCPTIMFHAAPEKKKETEQVLADFQGGDEQSGLVGIMLWERDGQLTELEAWSIDGSEVTAWPNFETIRPLEITHIR
jgi:hypothetical protein